MLLARLRSRISAAYFAFGRIDLCRPALEQNHFRKFITLAASAARLIASGQRRDAALPENLHTCWLPLDAIRNVDPDLESFMNCNTPNDYKKA